MRSRTSDALDVGNRRVGLYGTRKRLCDWSMNMLIDAFIGMFGPHTAFAALVVFIMWVIQYTRG